LSFSIKKEGSPAYLAGNQKQYFQISLICNEANLVTSAFYSEDHWGKQGESVGTSLAQLHIKNLDSGLQ
jgi:hypothetical protein